VSQERARHDQPRHLCSLHESVQGTFTRKCGVFKRKPEDLQSLQLTLLVPGDVDVPCDVSVTWL
jgi:hypothetical protein